MYEIKNEKRVDFFIREEYNPFEIDN